MKVSAKKIACTVLAIILINAAWILGARVFFGYNVFDRSGWRLLDDGTYQYLNERGEPLVGWQELDGETYYFSPEQNGNMATGWLDVDDARYYLKSDGRKLTGWAQINDVQYYFDDNGVMQSGWIDWEENRYYLTQDGTIHTGWLDTEEGRFYLSENGVMQTGWLQTTDGLYYLSESGAVVPGWVETAGKRYYINEDGSLYTGWLESDGNTYFLKDSGTAYTGWMDTEEGRYYFLEDGKMAVGEVLIDGVSRYFTSSGKYLVLVNRWNFVPDDYEADLVWFEGFQVDSSCLDSLEEMVTDCRAEGYLCNLSSAYRGYSYQNTLFQRKVNKLMDQGYTRKDAENETARSIAIPGTSEHQLGLAVDLKNTYSTYAWLAENSWKYGFILRYPDGTTSLTGIYYEPWHFRYVGTELAAELFELDLCLEAYMDLLTEEAAQ